MSSVCYSGWFLPEAERQRLLQRFPPRYPDVIAHHVTHIFGSKAVEAPEGDELTVIGHFDDGEGVEALVIDTPYGVRRPDDRRYHLTWSIDRAAGFKPVDANRVSTGAVTSVDPISVPMAPCLFDDDNNPIEP